MGVKKTATGHPLVAALSGAQLPVTLLCTWSSSQVVGERQCEPTSESLQCKGAWRRRGGKKKALLHIYFCRERREAPTSVKQERDAITNREVEKLKMQFAKIKMSESVTISRKSPRR